MLFAEEWCCLPRSFAVYYCARKVYNKLCSLEGISYLQACMLPDDFYRLGSDALCWGPMFAARSSAEERRCLLLWGLMLFAIEWCSLLRSSAVRRRVVFSKRNILLADCLPRTDALPSSGALCRGVVLSAKGRLFAEE